MQALMCLSMSLRFLKWNRGCCSNYARSSGAPWRFGFAVLWLLGCKRLLEQQLRGGLCDSDNLKCVWCHSLCIRVIFTYGNPAFYGRQENKCNCEDSSLPTVLINFFKARGRGRWPCKQLYLTRAQKELKYWRCHTFNHLSISLPALLLLRMQVFCRPGSDLTTTSTVPACGGGL